ncbi:MAG: hypothetical protein H0S84_03190 [Bacteroidales bacterium]|nr:hypothetical protein [Bacteroidales bacterium]
MAKIPAAQPPQKGQSKYKTFQPILRQNPAEVLANLYFESFAQFKSISPHLSAGKQIQLFDQSFNLIYLTLTRKTSRPIWKKL